MTDKTPAESINLVKMKIPARTHAGKGVATQIHERLVASKGKFLKGEEVRVWGGEKHDTANKASYIASKLKATEPRHYEPCSRGNQVFVTITK